MRYSPPPTIGWLSTITIAITVVALLPDLTFAHRTQGPLQGFRDQFSGTPAIEKTIVAGIYDLYFCAFDMGHEVHIITYAKNSRTGDLYQDMVRLEVHGPDQGQVIHAGELMLEEAGVQLSDALAPQILTDEVIRKVSPYQAMLLNRTRAGMLVLGDDALYTLEVNPAVYVTLAANEAEKASGVRLVGLGAEGAVGRLRLAGSDAAIDEAVAAVRRALGGIQGRDHGEGR